MYEEGEASPHRPESVAAFARWAGAAAEHFKGRRIVWEIWNEPNISFWKPKPDVRAYTTLALATCQAIRAADPKATVVAPATSEMPLEFLDRFFASGALAHLDGVSVHPYRHPRPPENGRGRLPEAPPPHRTPRAGGQEADPNPERGMGLLDIHKGVSQETQAAYLVRQQLTNLLNGITLSIWYDWKDDGTNPAENEHNFGTVKPDLQPKPAYVAVKTLTHELDGFRIARRLDVASDKDFVLLLVNTAGKHKLAAWTMGEAHSVSLGAGAKLGEAVSGVKMAGEAYTPKNTEKGIELELDGATKYITLK